MMLLIFGVCLWSIVHFIPSLGVSFKNSLISKWGNKTYAAVFSVFILISLLCIILGWRSTTPTYLYTLPLFFRHIAMLLIVIGFILFGAAKYPTRIKRAIRHPQLTGVAIWACAHLLMNGDSRSVILFGGLGIWAILEMILINKREGEWIKPEPPEWKREIRGLLISLTVFIVLVLIHPYIAGVPVR